MHIDNAIKNLSASLVSEVRKILGEKKLVGGQKKIDVNHNGKLDADDFKKLRKEESEEVAETEVVEEEQIDELSKSTLGSYIKKAATSAANKGMEHGQKKAERDEVDRMTNRHMSFGDKDKIHQTLKTTHRDVEEPREKAGKRIAGINKAVSKLAKEEVELTQEEIDRLDAMMADLDEARGRPPKPGSEAHKRQMAQGASEADEPRQHIIQQLQRAKLSMRGGENVRFKDGSTHHVPGTHASRILSKYAGMKPHEKETLQKEVGASHEGLKKHI